MNSSSLQEITMQAPVTRVLLFEDRAQVTRTGTVEIPQGLSRIRVERVPPIAVDRSIRLQQSSEQPAELLEVRVRRQIQSKEQNPEEFRRWEQEKLKVQMQRSHIEQEQERLYHKLQFLSRSTDQLVDFINRATGLNQTDTATWSTQFDTLQTQRKAATLDQHRIEEALKECDKELAAIEERKQKTTQPLQEIGANLEALFESENATQTTLTWEYLVPCALWRPQHQARLLEHNEQAELHFETSAMVWQNTGEDWNNVELACSTARPTQATSPPLLTDEYLSSRKRTEEERRTIITSFREEEIASTGASSGAKLEVPGVDDGGEVRHFVAPQKVSIPSHGRPVRVPLYDWKTKCTSEWLCLPELRPALLQQTSQTNPHHQPILAGPVTLIQSSGYVGTTAVNYVAPQESFQLGWGSEENLHIYREVEQRESKKVLSNHRHVGFIVTLYLSNLSNEPIRFQLRERIPVSELEQVTIQVVDRIGMIEKYDHEKQSPITQPTQPKGPDKDGMVTWDIELKGHAQKTYTLAYMVKAASKVVLPF